MTPEQGTRRALYSPRPIKTKILFSFTFVEL